MNRATRFLGPLAAIATTTVLAVGSAQAITVNFDTNASGVPFVGLGSSFSTNEYAGLGFRINDSDPTSGSTFVNLTNPANVGTAISGYYVNVGAFANTTTFAAIDFLGGAQHVQFDFATPSGNIFAFAFGPSGFLGAFALNGTNNFWNQAGFNVESGHANLSGLGTITSLLIQASPNEGLILDNLSLTPVPEPSTYLMMLAGLGLLYGFARRRSKSDS